MPDPYQIRLVVNGSPGSWSACWVESGGQQSDSFPLALPLTADDMADLRWYLETYHQFPGAGDHARAEGVQAKLVDWGRRLFDAAFGTAGGANVHRNLMDAADEQQAALLTLGAEAPDVLGQPWEMMRDGQGPLVFRGVTIRRQLKGSGKSRRYQVRLPLRVLLIVSRPTDISFIDPRNSIGPLLDALAGLPVGSVKVDFCDPPTLPGLEQMISAARKAKSPYHIVHFDGHGTYLPLTGVGALAFERDDAKMDLVSGKAVGDLLSRLKVPVVLLEACRSSDLSERPVFGSVAPALLGSGVGSVIAFSHAVHVKAARLLVQRFYQELADGLTVGRALEEARAALHADRSRWLHHGPNAESVQLEDWFIPQLYQVGDDPALVTAARGGKRRRPTSEIQEERGEPALPDFPPPPMYRFHGRAQELLDLERCFRRHAAVVVTGMGGMGKTALAREAAHWWLRTGRFESAVFCSFEQKAGAERVVQLLGQALEGDTFGARPAEDQWQTAVSLFRRRRVLLVWDNFESTLPIYQRGEQDGSAPLSLVAFGDEARARVLRLYGELTADLPKGGRLLVTCRPEDTGLPGVKEFPLGGLARPDSLHLLAAIFDQKGIATERPGYERAEIDALLKALGDHPLSVALVGPHLKTLTPAGIRAEFGQLLERFTDPTAPEARNRSLLASLEFSKKRLSAAARKVLPYLAWFEGGVFEQGLLLFAELTPADWTPIRSELVATALLGVEELGEFTTPYLRFHSTLPYAARAAEIADPEAAEQRFLAVYLRVRQMVEEALRGRRPAAGMALMAREEANLRAAIARAFRRGDRTEGQSLADTLLTYLQRAVRLRERDALIQWVQEQMPQGDRLDSATCAAIRDYAESRCMQGHADEAVQAVQALINRLENEGLAGGNEPASQLALSYFYLGRIYRHAGHPASALQPLQKSIAGLERLGEEQRGNLGAALGDLAIVYRRLGQYDAALKVAEQGLAIYRELGNSREIATNLGRIAGILVEQQRYAEADTRFDEAFRAALAAGDRELQGSLLQHQGGLQDNLGNHDRAVELYKQAIALSQQGGNPGAEMRTCNLLAVAEVNRGHLDAAAAWYARSSELARQLNDRRQLAAVAQNIGILHQTRAEQASDPATRAALLRQAAASVEESLSINLEMNNQVGVAASYGQLALLYRELGELDKAEVNAQQALHIHESLGLPDVYKAYATLSAIARDRGDLEAAARWQAKYEAKVAELKRLRRGEGAGAPAAGVSEEVVQAIGAIAQACLQARAGNGPLPPDAAEGLAQLAGAPAPWGAVAAFLQAVAAGHPVPPVPVGLPPAVAEVLDALAKGIQP
jgi:tetratricopeptide (TPR) repeat protein